MSEGDKVEWHKRGWRWWLEAAAKLVCLSFIFWLISEVVGVNQPRWVINASIFVGLLICFPLIPFAPRKGGDDVLTLKDSIFGSAIILATLLAIALLIGLVFAYFTVLPGFFEPVLSFIGHNKIEILLFVIAVTLIGIYQRMGTHK